MVKDYDPEGRPTNALAIPYRSSNQSLGTTLAPSPTKGSVASDEKHQQYPWSGHQNDTLPKETFLAKLRFKYLTWHARFLLASFISNIVIMIWYMETQFYHAKLIGLPMMACIFGAILIKQELLYPVWFLSLTSIPPSWPLFIRRYAAQVTAFGGIHEGAAFATIAWYIFFTVQVTKEALGDGLSSVAAMVLTYILAASILVLVIPALPPMRNRYPALFQYTHRNFGFAVFAVVWGQFMVLTIDYVPPDMTLSQIIWRGPPFWLVVILTCAMIYPWFFLKKVAVTTERLSPDAVRLWFNYGRTPTPGTYMKFTTTPLRLWGAYPAISEPNKKGYSIVISRGSPATAYVDNPPEKLWTMGLPTFGTLAITRMFRRVLLVTTGNGIAHALPFILKNKTPLRLLWTAPNVRDTFGDKFVDSVVEANPDAVLYDTLTHGEPDMVKLTLRLAKSFDAEAVIVVSNSDTVNKVVYGCLSRGVVAFGDVGDW